MDQEDKKEEVNEVSEETEKAPAEETKQPKHDNKKKGLSITAIILIVIVGGAFTIIQYYKSNSSSKGCTVVPQGAFGQSQQQQWIEVEDIPTADYLATFKLSVPENPAPAYPTAKYEVYTSQIYEIRYYNSSDEEGLRITKGIMCGQPVYDVDQKYKSTNIVTLGDKEVTEYGDGDTISIATWTEGEYSYCIGAWNAPIAKDAMEKMIAEVE
jgi:hypothetical protein